MSWSLKQLSHCHCENLLPLVMVFTLKYFVCKTWNSPPENIRTETTLTGFKQLVKQSLQAGLLIATLGFES